MLLATPVNSYFKKHLEFAAKTAKESLGVTKKLLK